jgi:hypothetical protein
MAQNLSNHGYLLRLLRKHRIIELYSSEMNYSRLQTANSAGLLAASQEISRQQAAEIQPLMRCEHCADFP